MKEKAWHTLISLSCYYLARAGNQHRSFNNNIHIYFLCFLCFCLSVRLSVTASPAVTVGPRCELWEIHWYFLQFWQWENSCDRKHIVTARRIRNYHLRSATMQLFAPTHQACSHSVPFFLILAYQSNSLFYYFRNILLPLSTKKKGEIHNSTPDTQHWWVLFKYCILQRHFLLGKGLPVREMTDEKTVKLTLHPATVKRLNPSFGHRQFIFWYAFTQKKK